jgi:hypothetical protein
VELLFPKVVLASSWSSREGAFYALLLADNRAVAFKGGERSYNVKILSLFFSTTNICLM